MADHPNATLIRTGYDAFGKGDMDTIRELFSNEIAWHVSGDNPLAGDYNGVDEVFGFFGKLLEVFDEGFELQLHDAIGNDDHVVALLESTSGRKGQTRTSQEVHIWHVRDGKATEFWSTSLDQAGDDAFLRL